MVKRIVQFVSSSGPAWPWQRQIPGGTSLWGETSYEIETQQERPVDWLVVYEGWTQKSLFTQVPRDRRIFITGEPESFYQYQPKFLDQFGHVITTQRKIHHPGVIHSQVAINWFAGVRFEGAGGPYVPVLNFADFESGNPHKSKLCSVVCSNKAVTRGHRQRLAFVQKLREALGDQIDVYGRGFRDICDKDEALADYRFHIALENSTHVDYWTEKLADPFLRGCFPIYSGCPNLSAYFPEQSYVRIDITKPKQAIETIRTVINSNIDFERAADLAEAKTRIMRVHNVFALLERIYPDLEVGQSSGASPISQTQLFSDLHFKNQLLKRRVKQFLRKYVAGGK